MCKRYAITLAAAALLLTAGIPAVGGAAERASLPDIEDEVMCPTCGTPLNLAYSPQAERQRRFIRAQIERGKTKEQIKQALVAEFGEGVLALPRAEGFDLAAYVVPAAAVLIAAAALGFGLLRWWRRPARADGGSEAEPTPEDSARLDRDMSRYDL